MRENIEATLIIKFIFTAYSKELLGKHEFSLAISLKCRRRRKNNAKIKMHTVTHDFTVITTERHCSEDCNPKAVFQSTCCKSLFIKHILYCR